MTYQNLQFPDFVAQPTQTYDFTSNVDLLVRKKILKISKPTSDPKRAYEVITQYVID